MLDMSAYLFVALVGVLFYFIPDMYDFCMRLLKFVAFFAFVFLFMPAIYMFMIFMMSSGSQ